MGSVSVSNGLAIWNSSGKYGPGVVSETMSYAMILAALYDDKTTFDHLSATIQAGIKNWSTGLFPWYWKQGESSTEYVYADPNGLNSASDADINIALAYVYADKATKVYGWSNPSTTYLTMALNYIVAIRKNDFATSDNNTANSHVLAGGYKQAGETFSKPNNWHPDYSDLRAYQLFITYDTNNVGFWLDAIDATKTCWKAIFNFGKNDTRTSENANAGPITPKTSWVKISNPTYQSLEASCSHYSSVTAKRGGDDEQLYTADSQRLPIRITNYVNATVNGGDVDMLGVGNSNLTALGTSYTDTGPQYNRNFLVDKVSIKNPWSQYASGWVQNYTAAGLLAYTSNSKLDYSNRAAVYNSLNKKFGSNGTNGGGSIDMDLKGSDGFNPSLTLWALTVSIGGETPLQAYLLGLK